MVGPQYQRPDADVADRWLETDLRDPADAAEDAAWWKRFNDPTLDALVEESLAQNLPLRQAGLRVIESRARRGIAAGQFFPQSQFATGQAANNQTSRNAPGGGGDRSYSDYSVGLEAAWELDFWGRFRRNLQSADAVLEATVADYDAVMVLLISDVASNYVIYRSLEEQLVFTRRNVLSQQDTLDLIEVRFNAGAVSELDVATAQATLSNTQALVPQLEDALRQTMMSLCVLLGRAPTDLEAELGVGVQVPTAPLDIALGIPADLLRRRPDIRFAERRAAAFSAAIGVATADLYPSFSILGQTGFRTSTFESGGRSPSADNLFDADSFQGFIGLDISWPILNYGRIRNNIRVADAQYQEAAVAYQQAVLEAAAETEANLSTFLRSRERAAFLAESVSAAERTAELSLIQYRQGATDFLRVNQAQVDLVSRQNNLVVARADIALGAIATYRALGGGWETRGNGEFVPRATIDEMRERTDWGDILLDPVRGDGTTPAAPASQEFPDED